MDTRIDVASAFRALSQEIERLVPAESAQRHVLRIVLRDVGEHLGEPAAALSGLDRLEDILTALLLIGPQSRRGTRGASNG